MFVVNDDLSIYVTRGDIALFSVTADDDGKNYEFQPGDVVRIKVYGKKDAKTVVLQKDFPVTEITESVEIFLNEADTKIGEVISKHKDYWYEVELNPFTNPQTIIGYDEDGAKLFRLLPEGADVPEYKPEPEDIPVVDTELDLTSTRPVQNQAIARAVVAVEHLAEKTAEGLSLEKTRFDNLIAEDGKKVSQPLEYLGYITEETKNRIDGEIVSDGVFAKIKINVREANWLWSGSDFPVFVIPNECAPIEVGVVHTADDVDYVICYDNETNCYHLVLAVNAASEIAPSSAGIVNLSYALADHELRDIRVGEDGTVYPTAGEAVREQFNACKQMIDEISNNGGGINNLHQSTGYDENGAMSQAATTQALDQLGGQVNALGQGLQQASGQMQEAVGQVQAAFADVYGRIDQMANGAETLFTNALRRVKESSVVVLDHAEDISPIGSLDDHLQVKLTGGFYDNTTIISNCDDLSGWSVYDYDSVVFSLDTEDKTEGTGCFRMDFSKDKKIRFAAIYRTGYYTKDISGANFLCFDCFVSDASKWNGKSMSIELSSDWSEDRREVQYDYTFSGLSSGWNRVVIPLTITDSRNTGFCRSGVSDEDYDPTNWKRLRFYMTETPNDADFYVMLDNLFFTGDESYGRTISKENKTYLMVGGKNLLNPKGFAEAKTENGITLQYNMADNSYVLNGTAEATKSAFSVTSLNPYSPVGGQTLTLSCHLDGAHSGEDAVTCTVALAIRNAKTEETKTKSLNIHKSGSITFTCEADDVFTGWSFWFQKGCTFKDYKIRLFLEVGDTATQIEEYKEFRSYPIAVDGSIKGKIETHSPYATLRVVGANVASVFQNGCVNIRAEYNRDINKAFAELMQAVEMFRGGE